LNIFTPRAVLALAPHTDDIELGCGATLARVKRAGADIDVAVFSFCEESVPEGFRKDILHEEFAASMDVLGVPNERRHGFDFPVRNFGDHRQAILQTLIDLRKRVCPDLVVAPASSDNHQDHAVIAREAQRAFKSCCLLGFELPWNATCFSADLFCRIEDRDLAMKEKMLACYVSQSHRSYASAGFLKSLARVRGVQANCGIAEAFEVFRLVV
jgi:LmbE family N-acetylglucosaminyl deacetylase